VISELHHAAQFVALGARGEIGAHVGFEQARYLSLPRADFGLHAEPLLWVDVGFQRKAKVWMIIESLWQRWERR